ncbi:hypothetical protein BASA61_002621 [Batrachochytrium salamandrivorans]|nr:hypothetical protein BASA61_002621 [Batrachochytrium salamandrivorans]
MADIEPDLRLTWHERQTLTSTAATSDSVPDINNDLDRELAFYTHPSKLPRQHETFAKRAKSHLHASDYFAEMVKSDQHMHRVRQRLVEEAEGISLSVGDDDNQSGGVSAGRNSGGRNGRTGTDAGADDEFGIEIDRPKKQGPASRGLALTGKANQS